MAADAYAGQGNGRVTPTAVRENQDNVAPADRAAYNPKDASYASVPGAAAREAGYPRLS
jgi:hypothetical protein